MSIVGDFTVPADSFALHHALTVAPAVTIEADRLVSHSTEWVLPFLWVSGEDAIPFDDAIRADPTVSEAEIIEEAAGESLYQVKWAESVTELITDITDQHASVLDAKARGDTWRIKMRFADDEHIGDFQEHFAARGHTFTVNQLSHPQAPRQREFGLTATQRDTLVTALEAGYFEIPRGLSIEGLAERLGVSTSAVSERLRRGSATLIRQTLTIGAGTSDATSDTSPQQAD